MVACVCVCVCARARMCMCVRARMVCVYACVCVCKDCFKSQIHTLKKSLQSKSPRQHPGQWHIFYVIFSNTEQLRKQHQNNSIAYVIRHALLSSHTPSTGVANLPPTTVITDYTIGLEILSANGQFFVTAQTALDSSNRQLESHQAFLFIIAKIAYASKDKTRIV